MKKEHLKQSAQTFEKLCQLRAMENYTEAEREIVRFTDLKTAIETAPLVSRALELKANHAGNETQ